MGGLAAVVILSGIVFQNEWLLFAGLLLLIVAIWVGIAAYRHHAVPHLLRSKANPILKPNAEHQWESQAVFNPAALYHDGKVHLLYRALGSDGISRLGYAVSEDGFHFKRFTYPVYEPFIPTPSRFRNPFTSPARLKYDRALWASGGGWGGAEDPRMVKIGNHIYVTFNMFNGWDDMRVCLLSIHEKDFARHNWEWMFNHLSAPGRHKNWVLFPEKINGKYAIFHNLYDNDPNRVRVEYTDEIEGRPLRVESPDPHYVPDRQVGWHNRTRSAGPPPIKTSRGWLLFYHAMDPKDPNRYKVGAMLLDLNDPTKVMFRSSRPILEPDAPYENDWKPGIIYTSGAIVKNGVLFLYYGGGDKTISVATAPLERFLDELTRGEHAVLRKI